MNPDLQKERDNCTFNITELTNLIDGGPQKTEERKKRGDFNFTCIFFIDFLLQI